MQCENTHVSTYVCKYSSAQVSVQVHTKENTGIDITQNPTDRLIDHIWLHKAFYKTHKKPQLPKK